MKKQRLLRALSALTLFALVVGCSSGSTTAPKTDTSTEQLAVSGTLASVPELLDDGLFDTQAQTNLAPALKGMHGAAGSTAAAIDPFFFWRAIGIRSRTFEFAFADTDTTGLPTTVVVTVRRRFIGTFNIVPRNPIDPNLPDPDHMIRKPLDDRWTRRFLLKRVHIVPGDHPLWKITAATAVDVTSKDATSAITSVRVQTATRDTTLTDPHAFIYLRQALRFAADEVVTLTVATPRVDDVVLLYHHDQRVRLQNNNDGTYTGTFPAGQFQGWRHFGVNALSHGTLYDDVAPYDSKAWVFPYVIVGGPDVDYLP